MGVLLLFLLLTLVFFALGLALHLLWWIAIICLVIWLVGFAFRPSGRRWYRW
jgi:type IV secretory pathway TrbD component